MKKNSIRLIMCGMMIMLVTGLSDCRKRIGKQGALISKGNSIDDIVALFTVTPEDIKRQVQEYITDAQKKIDAIIALSDDERTFANTARALDEIEAVSDIAVARVMYEAFELLSPDEAIREAAHNAYALIQQFFIDQVASNKKLYSSFMAYVDGNGKKEHLSDAQRYFLSETSHEFMKAGLALPDETLARVAALKNELSELGVLFDNNIAEDKRFITVTREQLAGLSDDFINALAQSEDGGYILGTDYPTYFTVMPNCSVMQTRKDLYALFSNRAFPANDQVLKDIIAKRDELAQLLGYVDFAHYDLDGQMVKTPERAHLFLDDVIARAAVKVEKEMAQLTAELPESVQLTSDGLMCAWDMAYVENEYKKNHFNIDEQKLAEYFPMENSIKELLDIYRQFLSIEFEEVPVKGLWHEDVKAIRVLSKDGKELLGTLLLDLYPRQNKYSHAAHTTIIPATYLPDGTRIPDVSIVIANFTKPTADKPSLLTRNFVNTFFHEFGHALHAILGAASIASLSGTRTKTDFVELPSQMLEEWLDDKAILQKISKHYQTGQPLPDDVIDMIVAVKNFSTGYWLTRQAYLSKLALYYFGEGAEKNPYEIAKRTYMAIQPYIAFCPENHGYASFGHLNGYAAKYYGYLWSKVFALDIFAEIKKHGLLDPVIGQRYVKEVLSKGGSQDPNEMLCAFLGREPNSAAFFADMGL